MAGMYVCVWGGGGGGRGAFPPVSSVVFLCIRVVSNIFHYSCWPGESGSL